LRKIHVAYTRVNSNTERDNAIGSTNQEATFESTAPVTSYATASLIPVLYLTEPGNIDAISISDINQGQLGDCFLLSSLGEIVRQMPSFISNMIQINLNGTETITLHEAASGNLPTWGTMAFISVTETVSNVFAAGSVNNGATQDVVGKNKEIWPQVVEKAYATLSGGYSAIANGGSPVIAMEELTGQPATFMSPANLTLSMLSSLINAHDLITMLTPANGLLPNNLVNDHVYMYEGTTGTGSSTTVNFGNPWGFDQPKPMLLSQLSHGFAEVEVGHLA
jgi:hypothetical protein